NTSSSELIASVPHNDTFLSPPQSAASSSQIIVNNEVTISNEIQDTTDLIDAPMESNTTVISPDIDDEQFWNSLIDQTTPANSENMSTTNNDSISDVYLTLLHSTNKDPT
ncbi:unnamed protein product, partial [Adineta steineri]